jgi:ABC-2 type transport system permease protein
VEPLQRNSAATESWIFAGRLFVHWRRYPMVPIQALLFPTVLLVTYSLLVGKSMVRITGNSGLDLLIPVCAVGGAMSGALGAGLALPYDRDSGLLTRMWIMPVHRSSALSGTLLAEAIRTLVGTALILAVGYALGFRFEGGPVALVIYLFLPVVVVVVFAAAVVALALTAHGRVILTWMGTACMGLAFACIIPVERLPAVARPLAEYQPVAPVVEAMRALSHGEMPTVPLLLALAWAAVIAAVFYPRAVRGYEAAAETGKVDG